MASVEMNGQVRTIQDMFFSKENISSLNKKLLEKNRLNDIPKESKKQIIDLLIKNMKGVYKSIDVKRINKKNFDSIHQQFNNMCLAEAEKELKKNDIASLIQPNASELKFKRDFDSNPNAGNKLMDRPVPSHEKFLYPPGFSNQRNAQDNRFDNLFKPIVDNVDENYAFNQYQYGKGTEDVSQRMDRLKSERDTETRLPQRPRTPDFLKPMETQPNRRGGQGRDDVSIPRNGRPDFSKPVNQQEGFKSLNEDQGDLYDINNIDQPINIKEVREDNRSFAERLKSLQNDRGSVNVPQNRGKIDFTNENFQDTYEQSDSMGERQKELEEIPEYEPKTVEQIKKEKEDEIINRRLAVNRSVEEDARRMQVPNNRINLQDNNRMNLQDIRQNSGMQRQVPLQRPPVTQLLASNKNIDVRKIQDTLKKLGMVEYSEVQHLVNENNLLKSQMKTLSSSGNNKVDNVRQDIAIEFDKLTEKDKILTQKEDELKQLIKKYNHVYGISNVQLDISPNESKSVFKFEFEPINNVVGIKLMSYSLPQARYNIEEGKNNMFKLKQENELIELKLSSGKYTIEELLKELNKKSNKYLFSLNLEQKVEIKSDDTFDILNTSLSKDVLGFINTCVGQSEYTADRLWDLRIEDKTYLYLNNIDDSTPFALLYPNNQGNYQFKFEDPTTIDNLELVFKDSKGRLFNFYGLNYSLNVQLEICNPDEMI